MLSPSTRHLDRGLKWARFETAQCPSYWIVDPLEPSLMAYELGEDVYREVGRATGREELVLRQPFLVALVPAAPAC